jgi:hypothetical protein
MAKRARIESHALRAQYTDYAPSLAELYQRASYLWWEDPCSRHLRIGNRAAICSVNSPRTG